MDLRPAETKDLPQLKKMYKKIIDHMNKNNVQIWDDIYPCEFFQGDIDNNKLYCLMDQENIAAAFALCETNSGEAHVKWTEPDARSFYIDRFGVNVDYARRGIGSLTLKKAMELTKAKGAGYLRLFVVDINKPAINLYLKNGFRQVEGVYEEKIEDFVLYEYGFEIEV